MELEAIGFAIFFILYLPFLIKDMRVKQQMSA
jgi:flagellar biosynthesis protein FliP